MDEITLGDSGLTISRVVFGAMAPRPGIDTATQLRTLHAAVESGITTIDTAPLYGFGQSETLVGELLRDAPRGLRVLTKVGLRWDGARGELLFRGPDPSGAMRTVRRDSRPVSVRRDVEQSLRRLGVEVLDLVQVHHPDPRVPIAETMGALLDLRAEGKLRAIGVSNFSPRDVRQARAALGEVPLASHQLHYNLIEREAEKAALPQARDASMAVLAYSPLARGQLADAPGGRADPAPMQAALEHLRATAQAHRASVAQVALRWLLETPGLAAVVGASRPEQIRDSAGATQLEIDPAELAALGRAFEGVSQTSDRSRLTALARPHRLMARLLRSAARLVVSDRALGSANAAHQRRDQPPR